MPGYHQEESAWARKGGGLSHDSRLIPCLLSFIYRHPSEVKRLRKEMLLHLLTIWEWGLLTPGDIETIMAKISLIGT